MVKSDYDFTNKGGGRGNIHFTQTILERRFYCSILAIDEEIETINKRKEKREQKAKKTKSLSTLETELEEQKKDKISIDLSPDIPLPPVYKFVTQPSEDNLCAIDQFVNLCAKGNLKEIKNFLEAKERTIPKVNCFNTNNVTPVFAAAASGHKAVIEYLIQQNFSTCGVYTQPSPLYISIQNDHQDVYNYLLSFKNQYSKVIHSQIL